MPLTEELKETLTLILAGGQGERLKPLTLSRAKPAVPFGGAYRIIDFTLSNCIHSGVRRIHVLTQYQARSLEEHIRFGWNFLPRRLEQFISVRPPHHMGTGKWYRGTADAIYQNLDTIEEEDPRHVLILSGDHIYKMDYGRMLRQHVETEAKLTIGAVKIPAHEAPRFGIFECSADGRVIGFQEKPQTGREIPGEPGFCLGSMGIYIFETDELVRRLNADAELGPESAHDFGKDVIPRMIEEVDVFAHSFVDQGGADPPYWRDVGTIDAFYDANLDLCSVEPSFNLYSEDWPTYTLWHNDPPAKTVLDEPEGRRAEVADTLMCPGVVVSGAKVRRSLLSNRVYVGEGALIEDSILFSGVQIGEGARVRRAIIDKWTSVPPGTEIGYDLEGDGDRFTVTDSGIVVVPNGYRF
ncbi:MAG: glucose-1-phosphate adenylyltransferase [bacterium]|nr:glucose-1-phosphate adenylyltransferase [bacterium]